MTKRVVRIANAGGYWGDDPDAFVDQVNGGPIDYLTADYLAEITMVLLQKMRAKDPGKGYALDFVPAAAAVLPALLGKRIRLVTNAGGVNPRACAEALEKAAARLGLAPRIAVVDGAEVDAARFRPPNADTGEPFEAIAGRLASSYAYLGARGIALALGRGADVVITGRVADASLTLGPLVHELGWGWDDWDRLAAGTVAGHVLECGAQASGGNATDWAAFDLARVGYPVAEVDVDGAVVITKHPGTGGAVTRSTVVEQLLYEIGDPRAYATPDVTVDFTSIEAADLGGDRVALSGARGVPPPPLLKAGLSYDLGWKSAGTYLFGPPDALEKARRMAEVFWARLGVDFEDRLTETFGYPVRMADGLPEAGDRSSGSVSEGAGSSVHVRLAVRDRSRENVERFSRRFPSFALSGPPGLTIPGGGRPPVQEVYGFWPALVPRDAVAPVVRIVGEEVPFSAAAPATRELPGPVAVELQATPPPSGPRVPLARLAFGRSGDKGNSANIGVAARDAAGFEVLRRGLTAEVVRAVFADECRGSVVRHELPGLRAFNFVLGESLGGGGIASLRSDPQGKLFAQRLLATAISS